MPAAKPVQALSPDAILTKATLRAADLLALQGADLAKVIGVSDSTVSRYRSGGSEISPSSKAGELALLLVRVFRSLDPLVGSDTQLRQQWMHSLNKGLGGVPAQLILKPDGLSRTLSYLDGMRAAA